MSVQTEIDRISGNVAATYKAAEELGANLPAEQNSDNLPGTIRAIPTAEIVQETGSSKTAIMSQEAVTKALKAQSEEIVNLKSETLPSYYDSYLDGKIETIRALQDEAGANASTFIYFSDSHDVSTQYAPLLAKKIMEECRINNVFYLGDAEQYSAPNVDGAKASLENMLSVFKVLKDKMLLTGGNHDGTYGATDEFLMDKNAFYARYYVFNSGKADNYGAENTYCYVDDRAEKTRYILLNTHDYPNITDRPDAPILRQAQYDWLKEALNVEDGWSVICFAHVPPVLSYADNSPNLAMLDDVLGAYRDKTTYTGTYAGEFGEIVENYTNKFDASGVLLNQRINSSLALTSGNGHLLTNNIANTSKTAVIRIKGLTSAGQLTDGKIRFNDANGAAVSLTDTAYVTLDTSNTDCMTITLKSSIPWDISSFRIHIAYKVGTALTTADIPNLIITVDEPIEESVSISWDGVVLDYDFTDYKGDFVALICGHVHGDNIWLPYPQTYYRCHITSICCDARGLDSRSYNNDATFSNRAKGTVYEQCLDVVVVNREAKTVNMIRIGAGYDREFAYS